MGSMRLIFSAILGTFVLSSTVLADDFVTTIKKPLWKGYALDWCLTWGADCGQVAADKYCKSGGYEKAVKFSKWEDLGKPTRLIGSGQVCDEDQCDSFKYITCQKADYEEDDEADVKRYNNPMVGKRRLDWCLTWAKDCGKPAADYYCASEGHTKSTGFKIDEDIFKTRILKTGQKCTEPQCDGFEYIDCQ
jgi:hypothetical protein